LVAFSLESNPCYHFAVFGVFSFFSLPIIFYLGLGIWAGAVVDAMANQCDFQCDDEINRTGYMGLALSFFIGFGFKGYFLFLVS